MRGDPRVLAELDRLAPDPPWREWGPEETARALQLSKRLPAGPHLAPSGALLDVRPRNHWYDDESGNTIGSSHLEFRNSFSMLLHRDTGPAVLVGPHPLYYLDGVRLSYAEWLRRTMPDRLGEAVVEQEAWGIAGLDAADPLDQMVADLLRVL